MAALIALTTSWSLCRVVPGYKTCAAGARAFIEARENCSDVPQSDCKLPAAS